MKGQWYQQPMFMEGDTMAMQAAQITVKKERGTLVVQAIGKSPKGLKYIKDQRVIAAKTMTDKNFKSQMAAAVEEMLGSDA